MKTKQVRSDLVSRNLGLCAAWLFLVLATSASATPVTSNLVFWIDAADPANTGVTPAIDNTALATWVNKAPALQQNGIPSVVQNTVGSQPLIKTGANGLNGLPVVRFDGNDDFMQSANAFTPTLAQPTEVFIVWKGDSIGGIGAVAYDGFTANGRHTMAYESTGEGTGIDLGATTAGVFNGTGLYVTAFPTAIYATARYSGGTASLRINGVDQALSDSSIGTDALDGVTIGGRFDAFMGDRFSLHGYIAEMLIYSSPLSTGPGGDREAVEAYLNNKWFVPIPEPSCFSLIAAASIVALRRRRAQG